MTGKGDRKHPETEYDKTRGNVALAKLGNALGVKLDASQPDHVLLEQLADAASKPRCTCPCIECSCCACPGCCAAGDA